MVSATRMELLKLKRRIALAKRGHKLLKDKRDTMMKSFMNLIRRVRESRKEVEELYSECNSLSNELVAYNSFSELRTISSSANRPRELAIVEGRVFSVRTPQYEFMEQRTYEQQFGDIAPPGAARTFSKYDLLVKKTVELASLEKSINLLAGEISSTRRRVNALERILIPRFERDRDAIRMKLDEIERSMFSAINRMD
ncbi:MAG: V-type ATP synthase subunit D [Candidatus Micrarchaeota archaeon]|nr:V-type ATP synthase subunit D [Candidatus Micrarchaeota archaeon]